MNIILTGYMGSGKTEIGSRISQKLGMKFIDLDQYIEKKEDSSITKIFEKKGDIYFRKIESKYLHEIIKKDNIILSLGGGTPCYHMKIIRFLILIIILVFISNTLEKIYQKDYLQ